VGSGPIEAISQARVPLSEVEAAYINHVLQRCGGKISEAANILGIGRNTLYEKIRRYNLAHSIRQGSGREPESGVRQ
jgi:DNA-binding NtrC family response regulator